MPKQDIDIIDDPDMILDEIGEEFEVVVGFDLAGIQLGNERLLLAAKLRLALFKIGQYVARCSVNIDGVGVHVGGNPCECSATGVAVDVIEVDGLRALHRVDVLRDNQVSNRARGVGNNR